MGNPEVFAGLPILDSELWAFERRPPRYTPNMNLNLDPATEQRIQREIDLGHYREPAEVIARAVELLEAEEDWLLRNKEAIQAHLEESFAQAERGDTYTADETRKLLDQDRQARVNSTR